MKQALEDSSYLLRERKTAPFSSLGLWRLKNIRRKEQVLSEPLITGECVIIYANLSSLLWSVMV